MSVPSRARHIIFVFVFLFLVSSGGLVAEERGLKSSASEKVDAVLVLDSSGSMLATDPLRLREEGAKLFSQFLKSGDRLSIVSFAEGAKIVRELKDFDPSQVEAVAKDITGIQSTGQYTNILEGIRLAKTILENNPRDGATPTIILLSDGKMDPASGSGAQLTTQLAETVLPDLKKAGVKVYTLAFSEQADKDLLQEIAALTDGINWFTQNADQIHESFANMFLAVKKPQVVPLTKRGFKIDADVQEATFYINREDSTGEIGLTKPNGTLVTAAKGDAAVKWFSGQKFEVVTITAPEPGDWQLSGITTNDGFATVLTNLKLITDWPTNTYAGDKALLEARLYEAEKPIALPEMSGVVKYAFQITPTDKVSEPVVRDFLYDDGTHGDKIERDGIFSAEVQIDEPGEYKLRVLAKAPTFERNQQIPFRVKPALVSIGISQEEESHAAAPSAGHGDGHANEDSHGEHGDAADGDDKHAAEQDHGSRAGDAILVQLSEEAATYKKVVVKLFAVDEKKSRYEIPLAPSHESKLKFTAPVSLLPKDGEYKLQATLAAEAKRGSEIRSETKVLTYNRISHDDAESSTVQVVVEDKKKKEDTPKPASPLIPIILVTLLNAGSIAGAFFYLKKLKDSPDTNAPVFDSTEPYDTLFSSLQNRMQVGDIDFTSPIFTDPAFVLPAVLETLPASVLAAAPATGSEPSQPQAEAPSEEAAGEEDAEKGKEA